MSEAVADVPTGIDPETGEILAETEPEPDLETDEEDEEAETEPEPGPEPEQEALSEKDIEARLGKLDKEATRHRGRISEILGEDATALEACPLCVPAFAGWRFPVVPDDDTRHAVRVAIGDAGDDDLLPAPDARACDVCNARGWHTTGSRVEDHRKKMCSKCNGAGYVQVSGPESLTPPPNGMVETAPDLSATAEAPPEYDSWGRPPDHPHYGLLPIMVR